MDSEMTVIIICDLRIVDFHDHICFIGLCVRSFPLVISKFSKGSDSNAILVNNENSKTNTNLFW